MTNLGMTISMYLTIVRLMPNTGFMPKWLVHKFYIKFLLTYGMFYRKANVLNTLRQYKFTVNFENTLLLFKEKFVQLVLQSTNTLVQVPQGFP